MHRVLLAQLSFYRSESIAIGFLLTFDVKAVGEEHGGMGEHLKKEGKKIVFTIDSTQYSVQRIQIKSEWEDRPCIIYSMCSTVVYSFHI